MQGRFPVFDGEGSTVEVRLVSDVACQGCKLCAYLILMTHDCCEGAGLADVVREELRDCND